MVYLHKAAPRLEGILEQTGVNSSLLEDVDVQEQFLIQSTLLDDINFQAVQLCQLEQYCSHVVSSCCITGWISYLAY